MTVSSIDTGVHFAVSFTVAKAFFNLDVTLKMDYNIDRMISCRRKTVFNTFPGCQGQLLTEVQQQSKKSQHCQNKEEKPQWHITAFHWSSRCMWGSVFGTRRWIH